MKLLQDLHRQMRVPNPSPVPLGINLRAIPRWNRLDEICHVTESGGPVSRWSSCARFFVICEAAFDSLGTKLRMRLGHFAQRRFAPLSTRGESTCDNHVPENTPISTPKWPPGLCFLPVTCALPRPVSRSTPISQISIPWGLIPEKPVLGFCPVTPPGFELGPPDPLK